MLGGRRTADGVAACDSSSRFRFWLPVVLLEQVSGTKNLKGTQAYPLGYGIEVTLTGANCAAAANDNLLDSDEHNTMNVAYGDDETLPLMLSRPAACCS